MCLILIYSIFAAWTECVKSSSVSTPTKKDPTDNQRKRITEKQENKNISDILYIRYKYTKNMINSQNIAKARSQATYKLLHMHTTILYICNNILVYKFR